MLLSCSVEPAPQIKIWGPVPWIPSTSIAIESGYSVGGYEFALQVRICTPYAGGFGMDIPNQYR